MQGLSKASKQSSEVCHRRGTQKRRGIVIDLDPVVLMVLGKQKPIADPGLFSAMKNGDHQRRQGIVICTRVYTLTDRVADGGCPVGTVDEVRLIVFASKAERHAD
jgi:hypothetical protein